MRRVINVPEEDRATDIGNMHKKFGKDCAYGSRDILSQTDRQTDTHTDIFFTILRRSSRRGNNLRLVEVPQFSDEREVGVKRQYFFPQKIENISETVQYRAKLQQ